jgi:hypothetical protein
MIFAVDIDDAKRAKARLLSVSSFKSMVRLGRGNGGLAGAAAAPVLLAGGAAAVEGDAAAAGGGAPGGLAGDAHAAGDGEPPGADHQHDLLRPEHALRLTGTPLHPRGLLHFSNPLPPDDAPVPVAGLFEWTDETWAAWGAFATEDRMDAILDLISPTMTTVPRKAEILVTSAEVAALHKTCDENTAGHTGICLLYAIPALLLTRPVGRNSAGQRSASDNVQARVVRRRCVALREGKWVELLQEAIACVNYHHRQHLNAPPSSKVDRAKNLVRHGKLSKAVSILDSNGCARPTEATFGKLQDLHPPRPGGPLSPYDGDLDDPAFGDSHRPLTDEIFDAKVEKLKHRVAVDRSGITNEHLKRIHRDDLGKEALFRFAQTCERGQLDPFGLRLLSGARLIALIKNEDAGTVRPIALPNALRKVVAASLVAANRDVLDEAYEGIQYGTAKNGAELMVIRSRLLLEDNPGKVVLTLDIKNAFNTTSRKAGLLEMKRVAPSLLPFFRAIYTADAKLHFKLEDGSVKIIQSEDGGMQGDPGAGEMFNLAVLPPLRQAAEDNPEGDLFSFFDDTHIIAEPAVAAAIYNQLVRALGEIGAVTATHKGQAWSPTAGRAQEAVDLLDIANADDKPRVIPPEEGFISVGVPIGSEAFIKAHLQGLLDKHLRRRHAVCEVDNMQIRDLLLRMCCHTRFGYWTRSLDPSISRDAASVHDLHSLKSLEASHDFNPAELSEAIVKQIQLPIRCGGLGYRPESVVSDGAYVSSFAACLHTLVDTVPRIAAMFSDNATVSDLSQLTDDLGNYRYPSLRALALAHGAVSESLPDLALPLLDTFTATTDHSLQKVIANKRADKDLNDLLEHYDDVINGNGNEDPMIFAVDIDDAKRAKARLLSVSSFKSMAFYTAIPYDRWMTMNDHEFDTTVRRQLGMPIRGHQGLPCPCGRGAVLDPAGLHVQGCSASFRSATHNSVRDFLLQEFKRAGLFARPEPVVVIGNPSLIADVEVLGGGNGGSDLFIDVCLKHPHSSASLYRVNEIPHENKFCSWRTARAAAAEGENVKATKYRNFIGNHQLLAFSVETYGRFGAQADKTLKLLLEHARLQRFEGQDEQLDHDNFIGRTALRIIRSINILIHKGMARSMRQRLQEARKSLVNNPDFFVYEDGNELGFMDLA